MIGGRAHDEIHARCHPVQQESHTFRVLWKRVNARLQVEPGPRRGAADRRDGAGILWRGPLQDELHLLSRGLLCKDVRLLRTRLLGRHPERAEQDDQ